MKTPERLAATQLANILKDTGKPLAAHAGEVVDQGLEKHKEILNYLKDKYSLGYGNANLLAFRIKELRGGTPPTPDQLLEAQYEGAKAALVPMMEQLCALCEGMGQDVTRVVQKTGIAFRRNKMFALVQAPSSRRMHLGLNLEQTPEDQRIKAFKGMCSHRADLLSLQDIDEQVEKWIRNSYDRC